MFPATAQLDGTAFAGFNCNLATLRSQIIFATGGKKEPTVELLRIQSGDRDGGTRLDQIAALAKRYGVDMDVHYGLDFEQAWDWFQDPTYGFNWSIWYGPLHGTDFDGDPNFTGNHSAGGNAGNIYDPLADHRRASIPEAPDRWPKALLKAACGDLNVSGDSHYRALGMGKVWCSIVRAPKNVTPAPTPPPSTTFRYGGEARSRGDYKVRAGITALIRTTPNNTHNALTLPGGGTTPPGIIITTLLGGRKLPFHVAQTTVKGANVDGSRVWHGDATGKMWIHHSLVIAA